MLPAGIWRRDVTEGAGQWCRKVAPAFWRASRPPIGPAGGRRYLEAAFSVVSPTCKKIVNTGFTYPGHSSGGSKLYQTVAGAEQEL